MRKYVNKNQEFIDEIMDEFDFAKVQRVMQFLNWEIHTNEGLKVPDEVELRKNARRLLYDVVENLEDGVENYWFSATGPFKVEGTKEGGYIDSLRLSFVCESWEAGEY